MVCKFVVLGMRRLEEEDAAKSALEDDKKILQAELADEKRRAKVALVEIKTKVLQFFDDSRRGPSSSRQRGGDIWSLCRRSRQP